MDNYRISFSYLDDEENNIVSLHDIREIYERLSDDASRNIYISRLLLSSTGNQMYMQGALKYTRGGVKLTSLINDDKSPKYIYGAGIRGKRLIETFPNCNWKGLIDKNKKEESYNNVKILDLQQFYDLYCPNDKIFISNMFETDEIVMDLLKKVCVRDIFLLNELDKESMNDIYFDVGAIKSAIPKDSVFVDIGCFDGKDSLKYLEWIGNENADIYAFEPDSINYKVCQEALKKYSNIHMLNIALSDKEEKVGISGKGEMVHVETKGGKCIQTQLLDKVIESEKIGYIKMDVEGFEERVLRGAEHIIKEQHPALAISVYHKRSDILRIPKLILQMNKTYCFYMRHYSAMNGDTVLYAVDRNK